MRTGMKIKEFFKSIWYSRYITGCIDCGRLYTRNQYKKLYREEPRYAENDMIACQGIFKGHVCECGQVLDEIPRAVWQKRESGK